MLVLERRPGEAVVIQLPDGRIVRVVLIAVQARNRVRLGVDCDRTINIRRGELRPVGEVTP